MNKEQFNEAAELIAKIRSRNVDIANINKILVSCGMCCDISGTARGHHTLKIIVKICNKNLISDLLNTHKLNIEKEILIFEKQFEQIKC